MHPARNTVETPPARDDLRRSQPRPAPGSPPSIKRPDPGRTPSASVSPPVARRSAASSAYSLHSPAPLDTVASPGSPTGTANESPFGPAGSPQAVFPARDGVDAANVRRASRRRTGPLSASQREKAALIRKIGACNDCRRRRVAPRDKCHPSHHDMSWEEAVQKYRSLTPTPDLSGTMNRPRSASHGAQMSLMDRDAQEMDIDAAPSPATPRRDSIHERTPQPPLQLHDHERQYHHEHPHDPQHHRAHHRPHQHLHLQQQHHHHQQLHPQQAPHEQPTLPPPQPQPPIERKPLLQPQSHARPHPYASSHSSQPRFHGPQQPLPSPSSPRIKTQLLSPILPPPTGVRLPAGGNGGSGSSSGGGGPGNEARLRTPLPSGRNLEKLAAAALPSMRFPDELQSAAARIINQANPHRSRYDAVHVLLLVWSNEDDPAVLPAVEDLKALLETQYHYTVDLLRIPAGAHSPYRWLLQTVMQFVNNRDLRDSLKILYYAGGSYVDREREMVLSSVADKDQTPTIRWSGIQQVLEDASADTLVLMDAAYYPCGRMARREGVLELLAASVGWDATRTLGRALFTRVLADELRLRREQQQQQQQQQPFRGPAAPAAALSAAELHVRLMAKYHQRLQDVSAQERVPAQEQQQQQQQQHQAQQSPHQPALPQQHQPHPQQPSAGFPAPLHMQMAASARLPSILLAPCRRPASSSPEASAAAVSASTPGSAPASATAGTQLTLTLRLNEGVLDKPGWTEWMRLLPEGVCDVRCEGPFAFR